MYLIIQNLFLFLCLNSLIFFRFFHNQQNLSLFRSILILIFNEEFLISIRLSISYFESTEEYEKCAHLKKIQDFVEKNLPA